MSKRSLFQRVNCHIFLHIVLFFYFFFFVWGSAIRYSPLLKKPKKMKDKTLSILLFVETVIVSILLVEMYFQDKSLQKYKDFVNSIDTTTLTIVEKDTVYQTKTYRDTVPKYITKWKTKTDTLFKENNSIPHIVELKGKTYSKTITDDNDTITYHAHVSGYDVDSQEYPRLDSIGFTLRRFITQTNTTSAQVVNVTKKRQFITTSPSVTVGYDPFNKQWGAMVGLSLNFNVWNK